MDRRRLGAIVVASILVLMLGLMAGLAACGGDDTTTATAPTSGETTEGSIDTAAGSGKTEELIIGVSVPLSGPPGPAGIALKAGFEMAFEEVNAAGGIKVGDTAYQVSLIVEDSKATAEGATTAATKLCLQDGAKFIMGDIADFMAVPIYEVTSEAGALFFFTLPINAKDIPGQIAEVGPDKPLYIRACQAGSELDIIPVEFLVENYPDAKKIALVALSFPDYDAYKDVCAVKWAPLGLEITTYERIAPDAIDFVPTVARILESKPDAVNLMRVGMGQFPQLIKTLRDQGFTGPIMYPTPTDIAYAALAGPGMTDIFGTGLAMDDPNLPQATKDAIAKGRAKYGNDFVADSLIAYDQALLLVQMIEKAQSVDPATVEATFETLTNPGDLVSIYGPAYAGGKETTGVNRALCKPWPLSRMVNGQTEFIKFVTPDVP